MPVFMLNGLLALIAVRIPPKQTGVLTDWPFVVRYRESIADNGPAGEETGFLADRSLSWLAGALWFAAFCRILPRSRFAVSL